MTDSNTTISKTYLEMQVKMHQNPNYGSTSRLYAPLIAKIIQDSNAQSLSDYVAGKGRLKGELEALGIFTDYRPYDPAYPDYGPPRAADLSVCIDVLEHAEPEYLDNIIHDLYKITLRCGLFTIHTGPAKKNAPKCEERSPYPSPSIILVTKVMSIF